MAAKQRAISGPHVFEPSLEDPEGAQQQDNLMEKLRQKCGQARSWSETSKALRIAINDKRSQSSSLERGQLHKSLETLQKAIKATSIPAMLERLEGIARTHGLKFNLGITGYPDCLIMADMFIVQVLFDRSTGLVADVRVTHHGGEPHSCQELIAAITSRNFEDFAHHLHGLCSIYLLGGDKKQKTKGYQALQSLETDLNMVAQLQSSISGVSNYIHKSPLGILQPRSGGNPMKLTYFVAPYNLLNTKTKTSYPLTVEAITENKLGHSAQVCLEASGGHKLQIIPLMTITKNQEGKSLPSFAAQTNINSITMPACFVLKLQTSIPVCLSVIKKIQGYTNLPFADFTKSESMVQLIYQEITQEKKDDMPEKMHVKLPGQNHCYIVNPGGGEDLQGLMVSKIPFTLPTTVPSILMLLRQQLLFNTIVSSCLRPKLNEVPPPDQTLLFEVTPLSLQYVTVAFEHPLHNSMATAELDLSDLTAVKCKLFTMASEESLVSEDYVCKVLQRCLSIPITLRAILKKASTQLEKKLPPPTPKTPAPNSLNMVLVKQMMDKKLNYLEATIRNPLLLNELKINDYSARDSQNLVHSYSGSVIPANAHAFRMNSMGQIPQNRLSTGQIQSEPADMEYNTDMDKDDKITKNPMLASLLDQDTKSPEHGPQPSILSSLLGDSPNAFPNPMAAPKSRKRSKRKSTTENRSPGSSTSKSPKRKMSETDIDFTNQLNQMEMESGTDPFEPVVTGSLASSASSQPMLDIGDGDEFSLSESHVNKLQVSLDNFIKKESTSLPSCSQNDVSSMLSDIDKDVQDAVKKEKDKCRSRTASRASSTNLDEIINSVASGNTRLTPELLAHKDQGTFTPTDFLGGDQSNSSTASSTNKPRDWKPSFSSDSLDFSTDLLNPSFGETISPSEEMDLDTCDANAFGVGISPAAMVASKLENKAASVKTESLDIKKDNQGKKFQRQNSKSDQNGPVFNRLNSKEENTGGKELTKSVVLSLKLSEAQKVNSPQEALDLSVAKTPKEAKSNLLKGGLDLPLDLSSDSEVARITSLPGGGSSEVVSPIKVPTSVALERGMSSKKQRSQSNREKVTKERKKKSEKEGGKRKKDMDPNKDKKRRKTESDLGKIDQIYSIEKSKKPTTIKITAAGIKPKPSSLQASSSFVPKTPSPLGKSQHISPSNSIGAPSTPKTPQTPKVTVIRPQSSVPGPKTEMGSKSPSMQQIKTLQQIGKSASSPSPTHKLSVKTSPVTGKGSPLVGRVKSPSVKPKKTGLKRSSSAVDSKLQKTPTIKLKPLQMPSSGNDSQATFKITNNKTPPTPGTAPPTVGKTTPQTPTTPTNLLTAAGKIKARKKSLSAVIDNLTKGCSASSTSQGISVEQGDKMSKEKREESAKKEENKKTEESTDSAKDVTKPAKFLFAYKIPKKSSADSSKSTTAQEKTNDVSKLAEKDVAKKPEKVPLLPTPTKPGLLPTPTMDKSRMNYPGPGGKGNSLQGRPGEKVGTPGTPGKVGTPGTPSGPPRPGFLGNSPARGSPPVKAGSRPDPRLSDPRVSPNPRAGSTTPTRPSPRPSTGGTTPTRTDNTRPPLLKTGSAPMPSKPDVNHKLAVDIKKSTNSPLTDSADTQKLNPGMKSKTPVSTPNKTNDSDIKKLSVPKSSESKSPMSEKEASGAITGKNTVKTDVNNKPNKDLSSKGAENTGKESFGAGRVVNKGQTSPRVNEAKDSAQKSSVDNDSPEKSSQGSSHKDNDKTARGVSQKDTSSAEDKSSSKSDKFDDVFKAPTPKSVDVKSPAPAKLDNDTPPAKSKKVDKPIMSPHSDVSSPDNSLYIDCPRTPKAAGQPAQSRSPTMACESPSVAAIPDSPGDSASLRSPAAVQVPKSPAPAKSPVPRPSSTTTPASPVNPKVAADTSKSNPSSVGSVFIDDEGDLMDAAIMGCGD